MQRTHCLQKALALDGSFQLFGIIFIESPVSIFMIWKYCSTLKQAVMDPSRVPEELFYMLFLFPPICLHGRIFSSGSIMLLYPHKFIAYHTYIPLPVKHGQEETAQRKDRKVSYANCGE